MAKLKKHGKGIVLMHDFQHATAEAAMDLLNDLKAGGYKIVFMQPKFAVTTIAAYDEAILKQVKGPRVATPARPRASCARSASSTFVCGVAVLRLRTSKCAMVLLNWPPPDHLSIGRNSCNVGDTPPMDRAPAQETRLRTSH
jgi:hypothetical protein